MGRIAAVWLACISITFSAVAGEYRTFTDGEGRTIEAKILAVNTSRGTVQIELKDGKRAWVKPAVFSEDDQQYIREWIAADRMLSESTLSVALKKKTMNRTGSKKELKEVEGVYFEVTFNNRSKDPLEDLEIEYRYFVAGGGSGSLVLNESEKLNRILKKALGTIGAGQKKQIMTDHQDLVTLYAKTRESAGYASSGTALYNESITKQSEQELTGIWIRIYGPSVGGERAMREVCYPDNLPKKVSWD